MSEIKSYEEFAKTLTDNGINLFTIDVSYYYFSYRDGQNIDSIIKIINLVDGNVNLDMGLEPLRAFIKNTIKEYDQHQLVDPLDSKFIINKIKDMFETYPVSDAKEIELEAGIAIREMAEDLKWESRAHIKNYNILCEKIDNIILAANKILEEKPNEWKCKALGCLFSTREYINEGTKIYINDKWLKDKNNIDGIKQFVDTLEKVESLIQTINDLKE